MSIPIYVTLPLLHGAAVILLSVLSSYYLVAKALPKSTVIKTSWCLKLSQRMIQSDTEIMKDGRCLFL